MTEENRDLKPAFEAPPARDEAQALEPTGGRDAPLPANIQAAIKASGDSGYIPPKTNYNEHDLAVGRLRDRLGCSAVRTADNGHEYDCPLHQMPCAGKVWFADARAHFKCLQQPDEERATDQMRAWLTSDYGLLDRIYDAFNCNDKERALLALLYDNRFVSSFVEADKRTQDVAKRKLLHGAGITTEAIEEAIAERLLPPEAEAFRSALEPVHDGDAVGLQGRTYASLCKILRHDRGIFEAPLRWDEMACCPTIRGVEVDDATPDQVREKIELVCRDLKGKSLRFQPGDIERAIRQIAQEHRYHPVKEYLKGLEWDHVPRISGLCDILGVEQTPYHLAILKRWMVGCVARIFHPGCDLQMVLVLTGREDAGKSRFFAQLAGQHWFSDEIIDIKDKDAKMLLQRVWFWEWGELEQISARDWPSRKSFITSRNNDFRTPYGKVFRRCPRHCVIPSTANEDQFLVGRDGERRFWPVRIPDGTKIKFDMVAAQRDQLWAEAVHLLLIEKMQWHLLAEEKALLRVAHEQHVEDHPWQERIETWLGDKPALTEVTSGDLLEKAIGKPAKDWNRGDFMAVAAVMRSESMRTDWHKGREGNGRIWIREKVVG